MGKGEGNRMDDTSATADSAWLVLAQRAAEDCSRHANDVKDKINWIEELLGENAGLVSQVKQNGGTGAGTDLGSSPGATDGNGPRAASAGFSEAQDLRVRKESLNASAQLHEKTLQVSQLIEHCTALQSSVDALNKQATADKLAQDDANAALVEARRGVAESDAQLSEAKTQARDARRETARLASSSEQEGARAQVRDLKAAIADATAVHEAALAKSGEELVKTRQRLDAAEMCIEKMDGENKKMKAEFQAAQNQAIAGKAVAKQLAHVKGLHGGFQKAATDALAVQTELKGKLADAHSRASRAEEQLGEAALLRKKAEDKNKTLSQALSRMSAGSASPAAGSTPCSSGRSSPTYGSGRNARFQSAAGAASGSSRGAGGGGAGQAASRTSPAELTAWQAERIGFLEADKSASDRRADLDSR
jgi:hypothetical protein